MRKELNLGGIEVFILPFSLSREATRLFLFLATQQCSNYWDAVCPTRERKLTSLFILIYSLDSSTLLRSMDSVTHRLSHFLSWICKTLTRARTHKHAHDHIHIPHTNNDINTCTSPRAAGSMQNSVDVFWKHTHSK